MMGVVVIAAGDPPNGHCDRSLSEDYWTHIGPPPRPLPPQDTNRGPSPAVPPQLQRLIPAIFFSQSGAPSLLRPEAELTSGKARRRAGARATESPAPPPSFVRARGAEGAAGRNYATKFLEPARSEGAGEKAVGVGRRRSRISLRA